MSTNEGQNVSLETVDAEMGDDHLDGGDLCPACLAELTAGCGFCPKCAAPVTPSVAISPFERVFAEGYIYRQAVAAPRKLIVVIGAWLVFLPLFLTGIAMLVPLFLKGIGMLAEVLFFHRTYLLSDRADFLDLLEGLFLSIIGCLGLYHVTRNYLNRPVSAGETSADA